MSKLELERVGDKFNISGNMYTNEEAMDIADFVQSILQAEAIAEQGDDAYREKYNREAKHTQHLSLIHISEPTRPY